MTIEKAKQVLIEDYLSCMGIKPQKELEHCLWYCSPIRGEKNASFKVDKNKNCWYDFGLGRGGNLIDLIMLMNNYTNVSSCLRYLEQLHLTTSFSFDKQNVASSPTIRINKIKPLQHNAIIEYLKERYIDIRAAQQYCSEVYYRVNQKQYFAIGFKNDKGGYELRNRFFKGSSSPKSISTIKANCNEYLLF